MEENTNVINNEENNYDTIIIENTDEVVYEEVVQVVQVDEPELFTVSTDSAFAALGEKNEALNHALLHNRDLNEQHPIKAITGLREELDGIHALKTVESDKRGYANYYEWKDDQSQLPENRIGYFVSIHTRDHKISRCDDSTEIFGVTVGSAGFVGWQQYDEEDKPRDDMYALVANTGVVKVRCLPSVVAGDYVMSANDGRAKKTKNGHGYYVISIDDSDGIRYAVISLDSTMNQVYDLSQEVDTFNERLDNVEIRANAAINSATEALKNSLEAGINSALKDSQDALNNANSALDKVGGLDGVVDDLTSINNRIDLIEDSVIINIQQKAEEAVDKAIDSAIGANQNIEEIRNQISNMQNTVEESYDTVNDLISQMDPILTFVNDDYEGVAGFVASSKDNTIQLAAISRCLSNDYVTIDTWSTEYEEYTDKIFYTKDTGLYYYYDNEIGQWRNNSDPSKAGLSEAIASIRQETDKNQAMVESLASYSGEEYETIENWNGYQKVYSWNQNIADPYIVYYEETTGLYHWCVIEDLNNPWKHNTTPPRNDLEEKDIVKVYYAEDTERYYCYYDDGWHSTDSSTAKIVQSMALTKQLANKNEARIDDIVSFNGEDGQAFAQLSQKANNNEASINSLTSYVKNDYEKCDEVWQLIDPKEEDKIYYAQDANSLDELGNYIWKYWYWKTDVIDKPYWEGSINPADAGLTASLANIKQTVTNQGSQIAAFTDWQGKTNDAITQLKQSSSGNGALIESLVMNISKYSVGKYSQAYGLTIEEAHELLRDGTVFVPTEKTVEYYGDYIKLDEIWSTDKEKTRNQELVYYAQISEENWRFWTYNAIDKKWVSTASVDAIKKRDFTRDIYYVWDKTDCVWVDGGTVSFTNQYIRGDTTYPYMVVEYADGQNQFTCEEKDSMSDVTKAGLYYIKDKSSYYYFHDGYFDRGEEPYLAQNPNFEDGALYYWNTDDEKHYWQKVASAESNALNRAIAQMRQSVDDNSAKFEVNLTNTKGDLAAINATVDGFKSSIESVTSFNDRLTTIEQESTENSASLSMLAMTGVEGITVFDWDNPPKDKDKVYYDKTNKRYCYHDESGWNTTESVNNSNVANKIKSAGIITAINGDTSDVKISGDKISITADDINLEGVVTFKDLSDEGKTTVIKGDYIETGTITVDKLAAGAITADKLTVGDMTNYCRVNSLSYTEWGFSQDDDWFTSDAFNSSGYIYLSDWIIYQKGLSYRFTGKVRSNAYFTSYGYATYGVGARYKYKNGTYAFFCNKTFTADASQTANTFDYTITPTSDVIEFRVVIVAIKNNYATQPNQGMAGISNVVVRSVGSDASVIVSGTLSADRIAAGTITAEKMSIGLSKRENMFFNHEFTETYKMGINNGLTGWNVFGAALTIRDGYIEIKPNSATEKAGIYQTVWLKPGVYSIVAKINIYNASTVFSTAKIGYVLGKLSNNDCYYDDVSLNIGNADAKNRNGDINVKYLFKYSGEEGFVDVGLYVYGMKFSGYVTMDWMVLFNADEELMGANFFSSDASWLTSDYKTSNLLTYSNDFKSFIHNVNPFSVASNGELNVFSGNLSCFNFSKFKMEAKCHGYNAVDGSELHSTLTINIPKGIESPNTDSMSEQPMYETLYDVDSSILIANKDVSKYSFFTLGGLECKAGSSRSYIKPNVVYTNGTLKCSNCDCMSKEKYKNTIKEKSSVIDKIKKSRVYEYKLNNEGKNAKNKIGFVVERETPEEIISDDGDGINLYSMASMNWKATQEILERLETLEERMRLNERNS